MQRSAAGWSTDAPLRRRAPSLAALSLLGALLVAAWPAFAQDVPAGLLAPGNAAVAGFSGVNRPIKTPGDGADPLAKTRINPSGPALRVIDLHAIGARPAAQFVDEPKPFTFSAAQIGQVFAVALDNAVPPNIYAAATSAYGLPIVATGADGKLDHVEKGQPGAAFMPALWGPKSQGGGPGSIWRIDGVTGAVSLFADVTFNGAANPGPALGGLVYEPDGDTLLAVDRWTGLIHRFRMDGSEIGTYDHGVDGRAAQGLTAAPVDAAPLDIESPAFDSADPATYGYAAPERRVFGVGVRAGRLYYAVAAGLEIWSVALSPDGAFGADARREIVVPPGSTATEISKIAFDDQGRMILAERAAPTGAFDFEALTPEGTGRVLRYAIVGAADDGAPIWQPVADEYAIGFPRDLRNGAGGAAVGYDYDSQGVADRGACGGFLWSTGEVLRHAAVSALAAQLAASGPLDVSGLQGNWIWLVRPGDVPPLLTVFTDYDDHFDDSDARGHMGDLAIWRVCGPVLPGGWMLPGWIEPDVFAGFAGFGGLAPGGGPSGPGGACPADQTKPGFHCCPKGTSPDASGQCKPWCPNGAKNAQDVMACGLGFDPAASAAGAPKCLGGADPVAGKGLLGCVAHSPALAAPVCPAGYAKQSAPGLGALCLPTIAQKQCAPGQQIGLDGHCHSLCNGGLAWPEAQCCPVGAVLSVTGQCCPPGSSPDAKTGACKKPTPKPTPTPTPTTTPPTTPTPTPTSTATPTPTPTTTPTPTSSATPTPTPTATPSGGGQGATTTPMLSACDNAQKYVDAAGKPQCCAQLLGPQGQCCSSGYGPSGDGACCLASHLTSTGVCCPGGQVAGGPAKGQCLPSTTPTGSTTSGGQCCAKGAIPIAGGACCPAGQATTIGTCCPAGEKADARGTCVPGSALKPTLTPTPTPTTAMPMIQECGSGQTEVDGACCPAAMVYADSSGAQQCCPQALLANGECVVLRQRPRCQPGYAVLADGSCCPAAQVGRDGRTCSGSTTTPTIPPPSFAACPTGAAPDAFGNCPTSEVRPVCPDGRLPDPRGNCAGQLRPVCPNGGTPDPRGRCEAPSPISCPTGETIDSTGRCVVVERPLPPKIQATPQGAPYPRPEETKRPQRDYGAEPKASPQAGPRVVEPQIKRTPPPRQIQSRPQAPRPRPAPRPAPRATRCEKPRC